MLSDGMARLGARADPPQTKDRNATPSPIGYPRCRAAEQ